MRVTIRKSEIGGKIFAPSSKSYTHRILVCSALANGKSNIISPLICDDTERTAKVLEELGVKINKGSNFWKVYGGSLKTPKSKLFCGESGTTMRFMIAICSLVDGKCELTGGPLLSRRPIEPLLDGLKQLGVDCFCKRDSVIVKGRLKGGLVRIPGNISSQFISALLLIAPLAEKDVTIELTTELESKPYVLMTTDTQRKFGVRIKASQDLKNFQIKKQRYKPANVNVEGDWSSAAFLLAAGAVAGNVEVKNLNPRSLQADKEILNVLKKMGTSIIERNDSVIVEKSKLNAIEIDVSNCPDLFPVICVLCSLAKGKSVITGTQRLSMKESDRVVAMKEGLKKMGIKVRKVGDRIMIKGSIPNETVVNPKNDHRIAMAFAILGLVVDGKTTIQNAECVSKSFPGFWDAIRHLGANINMSR